VFDSKIIPNLMISIFASFLAATLSLAAAPDTGRNYRDLALLLRSVTHSADFVVLTDFKQAYEESVDDAGREYFNSHPQLVQRIREDLGSQEIHWRMEGISHRLVYAPELREEVAGLFTDYCREAVEDLLARTDLVNPYSSISTLVDETPDLAGEQGIKAYIVQNLAQEYMARYRFSGNTKKRIEINLTGTIAVNQVGSYTSYLQYSEKTRDWKFVRNRHTVWKSVSDNPYTVLMTPLEETLHIVLREHTEKAIKQAAIFKDEVQSPVEIKKLVDDWLAVEEAVVGGLVYKLAPEVVIKRVPDLPMEWIRADLETKARFGKYRLLPKAIALVENHGLKESIQLYAQDPVAFRALLNAPG